MNIKNIVLDTTWTSRTRIFKSISFGINSFLNLSIVFIINVCTMSERCCIKCCARIVICLILWSDTVYFVHVVQEVAVLLHKPQSITESVTMCIELMWMTPWQVEGRCKNKLFVLGVKRLMSHLACHFAWLVCHPRPSTTNIYMVIFQSLWNSTLEVYLDPFLSHMKQ